jgi:UDP-3-O-[3-hydroxymyristoyl] N-acetylglucosamine deacetylase
VLAALAAFGVDNILIQVDGPEIPIFDGSSIEFVSMIEESGVAYLDSDAPVLSIQKPVYWSQGDIHIVAIPSDEYRISYTLCYPQSELIKSQFYSFLVSPEAFKNEIASSRTFSLYEEIMPFIEKGFLKGGSLDNAVIIKDHKVMNPDGLRHSDEMVRHKILDMLGDLFLLGFNLKAHIIAIRSGHYANNAFAKELYNQVKTENC